MKQSKFLSLNFRDLLHVFLVALGAFLLNFAQETFIPSLDVSPEIKIGLTWVIAYIGKKFFEKPKEKIVGDRPNDR